MVHPPFSIETLGTEGVSLWLPDPSPGHLPCRKSFSLARILLYKTE